MRLYGIPDEFFEDICCNTPMRILIVATSSEGGAGVAARRSFNALRNSGEDASFLSLDVSSSKEFERKSSLIFNVLILARKAISYSQRVFVQRDSRLFTGISFNFLTRGYKRIEEKFDVIHFHATYNLANTNTFQDFADKGKTLVFTMHDERLATGGCHYSGTCDQLRTGCHRCPIARPFFQLIAVNSLKNSRKFMNSRKNVVVTAPSKWLARRAEISPVMVGKKIEIINNPSPDSFFQLMVTKKYVPQSHIKIGFVSQDLWNPYKGFNDLVYAIRELDQASQSLVELRIATSTKDVKLPKWVKYVLTHPTTDQDLISFYREIDVLIVPSIEDNSPSVIGESLALGTPVIGSNAGGIPELLELFGQPTFERGNIDSIALALRDLLSKGPGNVDIELVKRHLGEKQYVKKTLNLYRSHFPMRRS
jgi:glycosyltransferase involved in cell wall biosynthesis